MSKLHPFQHITFSVYKCLNCNDKRSVTKIPAMIDGVIQDGADVADECSSCRSQNIETLFKTKSADEFAVYCQIINMENEVNE